MSKKFAIAAGSALAFAMMAGHASALTIDAGGVVQGWNITPFSSPNADNTSAGGIYSTRQNNYAPINYPNHGHVPSPGGTVGEKFDLEEMHARVVGNQMQVLVIASSLFQASAGGSTFKLGDLLIDVNDDNVFDFGVVTQHGNAGLTAGQLYDINTTKGLQALSGSYYYVPAVANQIGAWSVATGTAVGGLYGIETASHSYADEANTWAYQFTFDLGALGLNLANGALLDFQMSWGCGNDVITNSVILPPEPGEPPSATPEPATAGLSVLALGTVIGAVSRRKRK